MSIGDVIALLGLAGIGGGLWFKLGSLEALLKGMCNRIDRLEKQGDETRHKIEEHLEQRS